MFWYQSSMFLVIQRVVGVEMKTFSPTGMLKVSGLEKNIHSASMFLQRQSEMRGAETFFSSWLLGDRNKEKGGGRVNEGADTR